MTRDRAIYYVGRTADLATTALVVGAGASVEVAPVSAALFRLGSLWHGLALNAALSVGVGWCLNSRLRVMIGVCSLVLAASNLALPILAERIGR